MLWGHHIVAAAKIALREARREVLGSAASLDVAWATKTKTKTTKKSLGER